MSMTETGAAELGQSVDGIDWRKFWLKNVLIDSGKLAPTKIARGKLRKNAVSQRLRKHHRMRPRREARRDRGDEARNTN
jgi:hypothetical protein